MVNSRSSATQRRLSALAAGAAIACSACLTTSGQSQLPSKADWEKAEREIKRLPPSAFAELPRKIVSQLEARGCTIPQTRAPYPHNVIRGEFAKKGQTDWAVLCSKEGQTRILVFWGKAKGCPSELPASLDQNWQQTDGRGGIEYSRLIGPISKDWIRKFQRWFHGPEPPPLGHQGIDDGFEGKYSVIYYCYQGKWLQLQGAD